MSSPVLPMTVISASGTADLSPRRKRAPPIPPARTTMRMQRSLSGPCRSDAVRSDGDGLRPGRGAAVHRHLGQTGEVDVQADRAVEAVVDDLVGVAGGEDPLRAGAEGQRATRAVLGELAFEDGEDAGGVAVVVQAAALA